MRRRKELYSENKFNLRFSKRRPISNEVKLGVNVDHVATLRSARKTLYPDPVVGALLAEYGGCDSIVVHLREDRRHIKERDVFLIKETIKIPLNLEMSINREIVDFALSLKPHQATLVPERRQELTTEGGIDLKKDYEKVKKVIKLLKKETIKVSLFIDPVKSQIDKALRLKVDLIEINTGSFSESRTKLQKRKAYDSIKLAAKYAESKDFFVAAGHGLDYENVKDIVKIKEIKELNIGHSIVSRAVFVGLVSAVDEMLELIKGSKVKKR